MNRILPLIFVISLVLCSDQIPAPEQSHPILLQGGTLNTVSDGILENTDILFESGIITKIGKKLKVDSYTEIIDASGKYIYPGLISSGSVLGLQEVGAVRATRDYAETGSVNPNVRANVSYNPDSELIPISRSNGILLALSVPKSGLISGQSSLMMLDGWTWEDATLKHPVGLHLFWPNMKVRTGHHIKKSIKKQKKERLKSLQKIDDLFKTARAYQKTKKSNSSSFKHDLKLEGMLPVLEGKIPIFIHANEVRQIESAIHWVKQQNLKMVLVGGKDSWRLTDLLKDNEIPVIYTQVMSNPTRRFEDFDQSYKTPMLLHDAGIQFCISNSESSFQTPHIRNIPYHAAKAVSYGLPVDAGLRSITLSAAEILGVGKNVGSLEVGKDATLFISDGDILDIRAQVKQAFIQGKTVDMSDRHKGLYSKYQEKYRQLDILKPQ